MTQNRSKPAPLATVTGSGIAPSPMECSPDYPTFPMLFQEPADMVGILAARSGVAPATVQAQLTAWQIGGRAC